MFGEDHLTLLILAIGELADFFVFLQLRHLEEGRVECFLMASLLLLSHIQILEIDQLGLADGLRHYILIIS